MKGVIMFGIKTLKKELQQVNSKLIEYKHDTRDKNVLEQNIQELREDNSKIKNKIDELKIKVREQTEADIYFSCAKISKKLLDGEPKESIQEEVDYRNLLMSKLQA